MRKAGMTITTLILLSGIAFAQEPEKPAAEDTKPDPASNMTVANDKNPQAQSKIEFRWVEREHKAGVTDPKKHKTICPTCSSNHVGFAHKKPVGAAQHIANFKRGPRKRTRHTIELVLNDKGVQAMAQTLARVDTFSLGVFVDGVFTGVLSREDAAKEMLSVQLATANDVARLYLAGKGSTQDQPEVIARFRFDGDLKDSSGRDTQVIAKKPLFKDGTLYVNGKQETGSFFKSTGPYLIKTPQMTSERFTVAVRFNAYRLKDPEYHTILVGGGKHPWFRLSNSSEGRLQVSLNGSAKHLTSVQLKSRKWYDVVCQVDVSARVLLLQVNGKQLDSIKLPDAGLKIAGDADKMWSFSTTQGTGSVFHGRIDELIVYDNAFWPGPLPRNIFGTAVDTQKE